MDARSAELTQTVNERRDVVGRRGAKKEAKAITIRQWQEPCESETRGM